MSEQDRLRSLQYFFPDSAQAATRDQYGEFSPFEGSIPTFPPGSSKPRYVMPDGTLRPAQQMQPAMEGAAPAAQRMQEIGTYNQITGAGAPLPRPDPRGNDARAAQIRQQQIMDYQRLMSGAR